MSSLIAMKSYDDEPAYRDENGYEVRINNKNPNIRQIQQGRFTIVEEITPKSYEKPTLIAMKSYDDEPSYRDENGYEVRINKKKPNIRQIKQGRMTIVEDITPRNKSKIKKSKSKSKNRPKSPSPKNIYGKTNKNVNLYPGQKIGRFTIKSVNRPKSSSPKNIYGKTNKNVNLYPGQKIGRFTIKSVNRPKSPSPKIKIVGLKIKSPKNSRSSPKNSRSSPKVKIGRFTIKKK
jgi:hypothetical protein